MISFPKDGDAKMCGRLREKLRVTMIGWRSYLKLEFMIPSTNRSSYEQSNTITSSRTRKYLSISMIIYSIL